MKKNAVGPLGILGLHRQERAIDGLEKRFKLCQDDLKQLVSDHQEQLRESDSESEYLKNQVLVDCRSARREMLENWDLEQETCISKYELQVEEKRNQLSRLSILYRRELEAQSTKIKKEGDRRRALTQTGFEQNKKSLLVKQRRHHQLIDAERVKFDRRFKEIDALVVRRLERLPSADPSVPKIDDAPPLSFEEHFDLNSYVESQAIEIERQIKDLASTRIAKIVESWVLPMTGFLLAAIWIYLSSFHFPAPGEIPQFVWVVGGVVTAGVLVFITYVGLMFPLKRQTLQRYPRLREIASRFDCELRSYRKWIDDKTIEHEKQMISDRDRSLDATKQWQDQKLIEVERQLEKEQSLKREQLQLSLETLDQDFTTRYGEIDSRMRERADQLVSEISTRIATTENTTQIQRESLVARQTQQTKRLKERVRDGFEAINQRIVEANQSDDSLLRDWRSLDDGNQVIRSHLDYLPIGKLNIQPWIDSITQEMDETVHSISKGTDSDSTEHQNPVWEFGLPGSLPVVLHRRLHSGLFIRADESQMERVVECVHQILWRLLTAVPPSRAKLLLIDPLGRGQNFANFMPLADFDPRMVGHRVWTTEETIEKRLGELAHHAEDVMLSCLRDRFERIEDYNEIAGGLAEPYTIVAAVGLPVGLSRSSHRYLNALIESGLRCGNTVIIVSDRATQWPSDLTEPNSSKILHIDVSESEGWRIESEYLGAFPVQPHQAPNSSERRLLVDHIGSQAAKASRVEVPLKQLIDDHADPVSITDDGLSITLGTQGAGRPRVLSIGEGVKQHVLIAGKTGSGKSTLLHTLITAGAIKYRPDQLQYYLLDFKKGVEFKPYADIGLPHARVIGIESEREFGKSVLQKMDRELQERGEIFRSYGVQSLAQYRKQSDNPLPRIMLIIDEFQELFVRDDRLASECAMLLDRIVRQGRSFGLHVVLSSQSLAGAYSLPRATLGQMAIRIAMQCSESDAALILADDNTAAKLIQRPGEAIYNDAGGLIEGNQPFQVAWLSPEEHHRILSNTTSRDTDLESQFSPKVVFEGNRPSQWNPVIADQILASAPKGSVSALLGEAVEIGPPVSIDFRDDPRRNVLAIASESIRASIQNTLLASVLKAHPKAEIRIFDGHRTRENQPIWQSVDVSSFDFKVIKPRDCEDAIREIEELVVSRSESDQQGPPVFLFIDPLERYRELRQEDSFSFSLNGESEKKAPSVALQNVLRDGPAVHVFTIISCASVETLSRWLPRASHRDLELRILGQMNPSDSAFLMDSSEASQLNAATALLYDDADGSVQKCRIFDQPDAELLSSWLAIN